MSEIVHLSARALIGEKFENVKRYRHRHFFYGDSLAAVFNVRLDELRYRHGFHYALVTPGQKLFPVCLPVNRFVMQLRATRTPVAGVMPGPNVTVLTERRIWRSNKWISIRLNVSGHHRRARTTTQSMNTENASRYAACRALRPKLSAHRVQLARNPFVSAFN